MWLEIVNGIHPAGDGLKFDRGVMLDELRSFCCQCDR